jgi:pyruvate dehydrogenase E1 component alpha subunit
MTYRWRGHVGPHDDIDMGLRSRKELDYWMQRCPIKALEEILLTRGIIGESEKIKIMNSVDREVEESVIFARESPYPDRRSSLSHVFKA